MTRGRFRDNRVRLQWRVLACNLGIVLQGQDLPEKMADRLRTRLPTGLVKSVKGLSTSPTPSHLFG